MPAGPATVKPFSPTPIRGAGIGAPSPSTPTPNVGNKAAASPHRALGPEDQGIDTNKLSLNLIEENYEEYVKVLKLTYLFDNMPHDASFSKFKKPLRNACRITLLGNLEEGLNLFNTLKKQKLPQAYIEMIEKNIRDVKYYLRGKYRAPSPQAD